jgi:hypothetical protein
MPPPQEEPAVHATKPVLPLAVTMSAGVFLLLVNVNPAVASAVEALVLLMWTGLLLNRLHLGRLAAARPGDSICSFARSFDCRAIDTWIIRAAYETTQAWLASAYFPLRATDRIEDDLRLDDEDLEYLAEEIAERSRRSLESAEGNPLYDNVHTVRDLVLFLASQPRADMSGA